jgi:truncated hemoglobin YjbI
VSDTSSDQAEQTPYEQFGGHEFFAALVHAFYEQIAVDDLLRPMYPAGDLSAAEDRLRMFLEQYWGGPTTYSDERGHPRLRLRHAPYAIDDQARDRWLAHMRAALTEQHLTAASDAVLWEYLYGAAFAMQNIHGIDERPAT